MVVVIDSEVDLRVTLGITLILAADCEHLVTLEQMTLQLGEEDFLQDIKF